MSNQIDGSPGQEFAKSLRDNFAFFQDMLFESAKQQDKYSRMACWYVHGGDRSRDLWKIQSYFISFPEGGCCFSISDDYLGATIPNIPFLPAAKRTT